MKIRKVLFAVAAASVFFLVGCKPVTTGSNSEEEGDLVEYSTAGATDVSNDINPSVSESRTESLDFIFNNMTLGKTTITISRSEWNQLLKNFDYFYKNENNVIAANYTYEKDGTVWSLNDVGLRLRGNTSRFRPQGRDTPTDKTGHKQMNADWSQEYYAYAAKCSENDYRQSHFKIDFEPLDDDDRKLSGSMKGVALKRMDASCTREIFCYDLFHRYGIWTAPRASHTRVIIKFLEENGKTTTVDYGVYEMFEEVNKQSLKARDKKENTASNAWKNNKGSLWKCSGGDLTNPNVKFGVENIKITKFDQKGNPKAWVWDAPTYDLKADKDNLAEASNEFRSFITELNALPNVSNVKDTASINKIKAFYEKWFDVEFFLKTYAINILVGMDDDYWGNANNYYLYFTDTPNNGRKVYLIPFDYDNTLGCSIMGSGTDQGIQHNPLNWGRGANRPLMDKIIQVPEYKKLFTELLLEVSGKGSEWEFEKCSQRFLYWKNMIQSETGFPMSKDLEGHVATLWWGDYGWHPSGYSLTSYGNNLYDYTREQFLRHLTTSVKSDYITFDLNGGNIDGNEENVLVENPGIKIAPDQLLSVCPEREGYVFQGWTKTRDGNDIVSLIYTEVVYAKWEKIEDIKDLYILEVKDPEYEGIKIKILNPPHSYDTDTKGARVRYVYVNGVKVSDESSDSYITATEWGFPYTEAGETYTVSVKYINSDWWSEHSSTNTIQITAKSGLGKFTLENGPLEVRYDNYKLSLKEQPVIYVAGKKLDSEYAPGKFYIGLHDSDWKLNSEKKFEYVSKIPEFNVSDFLKNETDKYDYAKGKELEARARFKVYGNSYGEYKLDIPLSKATFIFK